MVTAGTLGYQPPIHLERLSLDREHQQQSDEE